MQQSITVSNLLPLLHLPMFPRKWLHVDTNHYDNFCFLLGNTSGKQESNGNGYIGGSDLVRMERTHMRKQKYNCQLRKNVVKS